MCPKQPTGLVGCSRALGVFAAGQGVADAVAAGGTAGSGVQRSHRPGVTGEHRAGLFALAGADEAVEALVEEMVFEQLELVGGGQWSMGAQTFTDFQGEGREEAAGGRFCQEMATGLGAAHAGLVLVVAEAEQRQEATASHALVLLEQSAQGELVALVRFDGTLEDFFAVDEHDSRDRISGEDNELGSCRVADTHIGVGAFHELLCSFLVATTGDEYCCHILFPLTGCLLTGDICIEVARMAMSDPMSGIDHRKHGTVLVKR